MNDFLPEDEIRDRFSKAMSAMYQKEVPQYGTLIDLIEQVNAETLINQPDLAEKLRAQNELERLSVERHGAIRVGTPAELSGLRRLFAVMGMHAVGYYDLSEAGVPVHSTAFRPVNDNALARNPFRVFTSLLRLELIDNDELRKKAAEVLAHRRIFSAELIELIESYECAGGLSETEAERFVNEALKTFRWHQDATVDWQTYSALHDEHRLIADVVCFRGPHINHLTPRTLDIDEVQRRMPDVGIVPKSVIEGPPKRRCPLLLRQTSFKALEETIVFSDHHEGSHTARFGEIEQRGIALKPQGRALYDQLLTAARQQTKGLANDEHQSIMEKVFSRFPDDEQQLRIQGLAYFDYRLTLQAGSLEEVETTDLETAIEQGWVTATPITYEDFLPVSAAGIFQSNLGGEETSGYAGNANRQDFEQALGTRVVDELALYAKREKASLDALPFT
ncbi:VOC family protein [Salinicola sp. LHM]|uniref:2-oxoadipate dioxygenase/decarboxylase HglS n=1 Tax=Salinicola sp. LHM TaxID=3065298 RepID=UPI002ACD2F52|nr:VOC family protein [Salinicola sp. LHM]WQH33687.1 VOC family protein [Salinicola sp. LHM]